jgi:hypothetical protein
VTAAADDIGPARAGFAQRAAVLAVFRGWTVAGRVSARFGLLVWHSGLRRFFSVFRANK